MSEQEPTQDLITLTADIVSAHVSNNSVSTSALSELIASVYQALSSVGAPPAPAEPEKPQAAVTARKSLSSSSHIISMIDGKPYKMLKRHIGQHGHTPKSYREAFGLPHDYPMVATDYGEQRRALAKKIGLGRKPKAPAAAAPVKAPRAPAKTSAKAPAAPTRKPRAKRPPAAS